MIALYKDPKGEAVFDNYEPPSFKTQQAHAPQQPQHTESATGIIDSLKKRIQDLENMLALNQHQHVIELEVLFDIIISWSVCL